MKASDAYHKRQIKIQLAVLAVCLAALAGVGWLHQPVSLSVRAGCRLRVLDEAGKPVPNLAVTHAWGESVEWHGSNHRITDANGVVDFPPVNLTLSRWERFKLKRMPATVLGWVPHGDEFPFTISLPANLKAAFEPAEWQVVRPGDPSCFTNRQGVFVRYGGAFIQNQPRPVRDRILRVDPHRNTIGLGIPPEVSEVTFRVQEVF